MKGSSKLNIEEMKYYDTCVVKDPIAKASRKVGRAARNSSNNNKEDNNDNMKNKNKKNKNARTSISASQANGDGDVWIEKYFRNRQTGKMRIFFVSKNTGKKVVGEPPTGASRVMYLRQSVKRRNDGGFDGGGDRQEEKQEKGTNAVVSARSISPAAVGGDHGIMKKIMRRKEKAAPSSGVDNATKTTDGKKGNSRGRGLKAGGGDVGGERQRSFKLCWIGNQTIPTDKPPTQ